MTATEASERTALYRIFGDEDLLLYIGISDDFGRRWNQHARVQPWWDEMQRQTVEWLGSREEAEDAERVAIKAEKPKYNIIHAEPRPPRTRAASPVPVPREGRPTGLNWLFAPKMLPGFGPAAMTLRDPGTIDRLVKALPEEEQRKKARLFLEFHRIWHESSRVMLRTLAEARAMEQSDDPRIAEAGRKMRQRMTKLLFEDCGCCNGNPPAGMTCGECGATGTAYTGAPGTFRLTPPALAPPDAVTPAA